MRHDHFSFSSLLTNALTGNKNWQPQWPDAEPKAEYDVVIVGAGGHGLGAAYYLAKEHGITNVAVIEKGWLGGGNTGRNTTIIRSNYLYDESAMLFEHAMKLWEGLSQELNYNVMFSQRGVMMLAHSVHDVQSFKRHIHSNRLNGIDNEWLTPEQAKDPVRRSTSGPTPASGDGAPRCSGAAASPGTTRSPGATRAARPRAASTSSRTARDGDPPRCLRARLGRGYGARLHQGEEGRRLGRRRHHGGDGQRRRPHAARKLPPAGAGLRAGQAGVPVRGHVQHGARLHQPVRQGRTRSSAPAPTSTSPTASAAACP